MENGRETPAIYKIIDRKKLEVVNKPITESHGLPNECYISQEYTKIERKKFKIFAFSETKWSPCALRFPAANTEGMQRFKAKAHGSRGV